MRYPHFLPILGCTLVAPLAALFAIAEPMHSQSSSYCLNEDHNLSARRPQLTAIFIGEAQGTIAEACVELPGALVSVSGTGRLTLVKRQSDVRVEFYSQGVRAGLPEEIGNVEIDYFTNGARAGKVQEIGQLEIDYFTQGEQTAQLRQIDNLDFEYFQRGSDAGRLRSIGNVRIEYSSTGQIVEAEGDLSPVELLIVPTAR
ncbi:MAG: hypothetical protein AAGH78_04005 [Cyanobacteria bacterium P01_H01_bin.58]